MEWARTQDIGHTGLQAPEYPTSQWKQWWWGKEVSHSQKVRQGGTDDEKMAEMDVTDVKMQKLTMHDGFRFEQSEEGGQD